MSQTRKKILFLITKSNWGGAQRYVFDLATNLDPEAFEIVVALGGNGRLVEELTKKSVRIIQLTNLERDISITKELHTTTELFRIIRSEKPDILHINSSKAGGLGAFVGRLCLVPKIIFTAHGWAFNEDRPLWQKSLIRILHWITVLLAHTTIVVSRSAKKQMSFPFIQNKMVVIHNGRTNADLYSRGFARNFLMQHIPDLEQYKEDFWSITIGELHKIKQHDVTIRALKEVVAKHPHVRHIIVGDGDEYANLKRLISELDLTENVFLGGHILEASRYLKAFDTFILSSRSEGLAYVIIEACIAKLPIIASDVGGIPEIITHTENGLLFPGGDVEALVQAYVRVYEDVPLRTKLSQKAETRALDFTFETMLQNTITLYSN